MFHKHKRNWKRTSDIEFKQDHIAILHDIFLAFHAIEALFASGSNRTALHQMFVSHSLRFDESAFEIAVNHSSRLGRGVAGMNRPGANFLLAGSEKSPQAKQMIGAA